MKVCLRPALWSPLVLVLSLSQCVVEPPPMLPPGANSGYSLDAGPNLRRNRQDTRYLETTQPPPLPNPENGTVAGPPAPTYETPAIFDNSASPNSPSTPPAPDTAATTPLPPPTFLPRCQRPLQPPQHPSPAPPNSCLSVSPSPPKKASSTAPSTKPNSSMFAASPPAKKSVAPTPAKSSWFLEPSGTLSCPAA